MLLRQLKARKSTFPFTIAPIAVYVVEKLPMVTYFLSVSDAKPWEI